MRRNALRVFRISIKDVTAQAVRRRVCQTNRLFFAVDNMKKSTGPKAS